MAIVDLSGARGIRIGHRGPVLVSCFLGWPSAAPLRAMAEAQLTLARQFGRASILSIIPAMDAAMLKQQGEAAPQMQLPDAERNASLKESAATSQKLEDSTLASALVILPTGLVAVMIRSFVGALSLVAKSRAPLQTFKELTPAIEWLEAQHAGLTPGLQREVEEWLQK